MRTCLAVGNTERTSRSETLGGRLKTLSAVACMLVCLAAVFVIRFYPVDLAKIKQIKFTFKKSLCSSTHVVSTLEEQ